MLQQLEIIFYICHMNKIKEEILEQFEGVEFLPGKDKQLVGYAEMYGNDCIPLYKDINYIPYKSPEENMNKMLYINKGARKATGYEDTLIGHLKLDDGNFIYLHDKEQLIKKITGEYMEDKSGLFENEEACEEGALEWYYFNTIGAYTDGIPAFAILLK